MLDKIRKVERVFKQLDKEASKLSQQSGIKCLNNCSLCCMKKGLEANVLEFLPLAFYLVKNNQHEKALEFLETNPEFCINLKREPESGNTSGCSAYQYRGLICRLFGSAAVRDKVGNLSVYTCTYLKAEYPEKFKIFNEKINSGTSAPVVSDYYYQIYFIDSQLANDYNPINISIRKAIEKVAYYYTNKPVRKRKVTLNLQTDKELFMSEQISSFPDLLPELQFQTSRSSGPGGQNVNKVNSRVEVRFDISNSALLNDDQKQLLLSKLASKITVEGILCLASQKTRSQLINKEDAIQKLNSLIIKALTPIKARKRTKPTAGAVEKRLTEKRHKSQIKQNRQRMEE